MTWRTLSKGLREHDSFVCGPGSCAPARSVCELTFQRENLPLNARSRCELTFQREKLPLNAHKKSIGKTGALCTGQVGFTSATQHIWVILYHRSASWLTFSPL